VSIYCIVGTGGCSFGLLEGEDPAEEVFLLKLAIGVGLNWNVSVDRMTCPSLKLDQLG
jgi:hypothetical protein